MLLAYSAQAWAALVAVLGFAHRHWNHDHAWCATLSQAVFPIHLVHQTLTIVLAMGLWRWSLAPLLEVLLLISGTLGAGVMFYLLVRPWQRLRPWVGLAA